MSALRNQSTPFAGTAELYLRLLEPEKKYIAKVREIYRRDEDVALFRRRLLRLVSHKPAIET
jgi:hypothetical protein